MGEGRQLQHYVPVLHLANFSSTEHRSDNRRYALARAVVTSKGNTRHAVVDLRNAESVGGIYDFYDDYSTPECDVEIILSRIESGVSEIYKSLIKNEGDELAINAKYNHRLGAYLMTLYLRQPHNLTQGNSVAVLCPLLQAQTSKKYDRDMTVLLAPYLVDLFNIKQVVLFRDITITRTSEALPLSLTNPIQIDKDVMTVAISSNLIFTGTFYTSTNIEDRVPVTARYVHAEQPVRAALIASTRLPGKNEYVMPRQFFDEIEPDLIR
jgi:hypothetical protein